MFNAEFLIFNEKKVAWSKIILFAFAVRVVRLCDEKKEYVLSKQLLRCGTSIGANVNEAQAKQKWV